MQEQNKSTDQAQLTQETKIWHVHVKTLNLDFSDTVAEMLSMKVPESYVSRAFGTRPAILVVESIDEPVLDGESILEGTVLEVKEYKQSDE